MIRTMGFLAALFFVAIAWLSFTLIRGSLGWGNPGHWEGANFNWYSGNGKNSIPDL